MLFTDEMLKTIADALPSSTDAQDDAQFLGVPFHLIDLNATSGPLFNIFEGASQEEIFDLLVCAFSLSDKNTSSDFYRLADRKAARSAAEELAKGHTAASLCEQEGEVFQATAEKFASRLRELAAIPAINASSGSGGIDLASLLLEGGIVHIVDSNQRETRNTVRRLLLIRFFQMAKRNGKVSGAQRPLCITTCS